jgi:hypothetical protein
VRHVGRVDEERDLHVVERPLGTTCSTSARSGSAAYSDGARIRSTSIW